MASHSKLQKLSDVDRFSDLPDPLVLLILSKLTIKDAMGAILSSKRFMALFKYLTIYEISDYGIGLIPARTFNLFKFVDKLLMERTCDLDLERFCFRCSGTRIDEGHFDNWFRMIVRFNVKQIHLRFHFKQLYKLPVEVYMCETLQVLYLYETILLDVPESGSLLRLRVLELDHVSLSSSQSVDKLLAMCPVLEKLVIQCCRWLKGCSIHISGPSLKTLWLEQSAMICKGTPKILIDTVPVLETLFISGRHSADVRIENIMLSLVNATFDIRPTTVRPSQASITVYADRVFALLKKISQVKFLTVSGFTLETLSHATAYDFPTFHNLTDLELYLHGWTGCSFLPNMLACSPNLVNLVLPHGLVRFSHSEPPPSCFLWNPPESVPECLSLHIKNIEIGKFCGFAEELIIVQYLLKHGGALMKMSINFGCVRDKGPLLINRIEKELLEFHRCSTTCKIDLSYKWTDSLSYCLWY